MGARRWDSVPAEVCAAAVVMGNETLQSVPNCKDAVQRFLDIEL